MKSEYSASKKETLQQIWNIDMAERKLFYESQQKNTTGYRDNRWNMITYRVALAIYIRSPAAYRALKSFQILNLPTQKSLQKFISDKIDIPGECHTYLEQQGKLYQTMCEEHKQKGKPVPDGYGALIFDEVKVISKILWNSKNNKMIGYSMGPDELASLHDIYLHLDNEWKTRKTNYILQFLWRDICSAFDVMGPYYTCFSSLEHKFIVACVLDALTKLHTYGFKTKVIVCDGASSNLTAIKSFMGHKGTFRYSSNENQQINHTISPKVYNPLTDQDIFFIICPTHQMKNVIGQLYASRPSGAKTFERNGILFGWRAIHDVYNEDIERARQGLALQVPGLCLNYVVRDAWTRLNVKPSTIMQQRPMIAALQQLADRSVNENMKNSRNMTANYLEACYQIFEAGILSNYHIRQGNQRVLDNIIFSHQSFFENWITELLSRPEGYQAIASTQKKFLAWQTWDLQRVMIYGFRDFCQDFFGQYGDNFYITPKRFNGSAIETLFSQYKYITGSKLSATNYATASPCILSKAS